LTELENVIERLDAALEKAVEIGRKYLIVDLPAEARECRNRIRS